MSLSLTSYVAATPAFRVTLQNHNTRRPQQHQNSTTFAMQVPLIRLQCGVNSYDWGKIGKDSAAAKFAAATPADDFAILEDKPYAEASFLSSSMLQI